MREAERSGLRSWEVSSLLVRPSDFVARLLPRLEDRHLPIHSLFERSLNLAVCPTVLVTVTSPALGMSPFGLSAVGDLAPILPLLEHTKSVTYQSGSFWGAGRCLLTLAPAPPYPTNLQTMVQRPSMDAAAFHRLMLQLATGAERGLAELLPIWPVGRPLSGISRITRPLSPWVASALEAMAMFDHVSAADLEPAARRLIGLGLGLTPSGDDFLLGFIAGRLAQGRDDEVRLLARKLSQSVMKATPLVSASYLRHGFRGRFGSQLRHLVGLLHDPGSSRHAVLAAMQQVVAVGSTSGWDTLVGLLTSLCRYDHRQDPAAPH